MLEELNRQLVEAKEKVRARAKAVGDMEQVSATVANERARLVQLKEVLAKEKADVDKLKGLSLTGLFHAVLGDKDLQLQKERQEYLAAKLKYDQCESAVAGLERDMEDLRGKVMAIGKAHDEYEAVLRRKEEYLSGGGDEIRPTFRRLRLHFERRSAVVRP